VRLYRLAAEQGNALGQYRLGLMYSVGEGVPLDDEEAVRLYRLAAEQGNADAQNELGRKYDEGEGVPVDDEEAVRLYRLAAEQGNALGQAHLGWMYDDGEGVLLDDEEAVRLYRLAAEQGNALGQYRLGLMYSVGEGVPLDEEEAVRLYRLAAEQGNASGQYRLGRKYDDGEGVPVDDEEAVRLYHLAAEQGYAPAYGSLALMYDVGEGTTKNDAEAAIWYRKKGGAGDIANAERLEAQIASQKTNIAAFSDINFGTYYALVIGNNEYEYLSNLQTAVADAEAVSSILEEKYGFIVTLLTNATRAQILGELNRFRRELQENDNFFLYYAGHGELDEDINTGSWQPVNAEREDDTEWITNSRVTNILNVLRSNNVMVVADSCYSGSIFRSGGSAMLTAETREQEVGRLNEKRTRVALTSGGNEPVLDSVGGSSHSVFATSFLDVLERNDSVLMANELSQTVRARVIATAANSGIEQTPEFRNLVGHDGGDFLFVPKGPTADSFSIAD